MIPPQSSRATGERRLARYLITILYFGLVLAITPWLQDVQASIHQMVLIGTLAVGYLGLLLCFRNGFRPMLAVILVFFLCWLVIPSIYQLAHNQVAWGDSTVLHAEPFTTGALLLNFSCLGIFVLGYSVHAKAQSRFRSFTKSTSHLRQLTLVRFIVLFIAASTLLLPFVINSYGGTDWIFATRSEAQNAREATGLTLNSSGGALVALISFVPAGLATAALTLCVFLLKNFSMRRRHGAQVSLLVVLSVISLVLVLIYANPIANTRFMSLAAFGPALLLLWHPTRALRGLVTVGVLFFAFLLVYPLAPVLQGDALSIDTNIFAGVDFDGFQQIINTMLYVDGTGHTGGIYLLSALGFFIPRGLWDAKTSPASLDVSAASDYVFVNLSLPVHAEIYLEFGWIGILLACWLLAWLWCTLDRAWITKSPWSLLTAVLAMAQIGLMRGPLGAQVPVVAVAIGAVVFVVLVAKPERLAHDEFEGSAQGAP